MGGSARTPAPMKTTRNSDVSSKAELVICAARAGQHDERGSSWRALGTRRGAEQRTETVDLLGASGGGCTSSGDISTDEVMRMSGESEKRNARKGALAARG